MESQNHGFVFEDVVVDAITGGKNDSYTGIFDIPKGPNSNINYSIKTSKDGKSLYLGDVGRTFRNTKTTEFSIVVGIYRQTPTTKEVYKIIEIFVNPGDHSIFFSGIPENVISNYINWIKTIPSGKSAQVSTKPERTNLLKNIYNSYGKGIISINPKVDSKNQRRVQCSCKIKDLYSSNIPITEYTEEFHGIKLPYVIQSTKRFEQIS